MSVLKSCSLVLFQIIQSVRFSWLVGLLEGWRMFLWWMAFYSSCKKKVVYFLTIYS